MKIYFQINKYKLIFSVLHSDNAFIWIKNVNSIQEAFATYFWATIKMIW